MRHSVIFAAFILASFVVNVNAANERAPKARTTTTTTKTATGANKVRESSVVYVWGSDNAHGFIFHNDADCAGRMKEQMVDGSAPKMKVTTKKGAEGRGLMECPTCGHNHDTKKK